jgi:Homing endonuclease associated repeat
MSRRRPGSCCASWATCAPSSLLYPMQVGRSSAYSDEELLDELRASAARLGRSPSMREFRLDDHARPHPQTLVTRFGTWNAAKRAAGLTARRFATREELLRLLRELGDEVGRTPTGSDLDHSRRLPSKSLYWQAFGSLRGALREAGFDVPAREERLERAVDQGARLAHRLHRLPRFEDWARARRRDPRLPSEWQVYRLLGGRAGAWSAFLELVGRRLGEGPSEPPRARRARRGARGRSVVPRGPARRGGAPR